MIRAALVLAAVLCLAGCPAEPPDLKEELGRLTEDLSGKVHPLPRFKEPEQAVYRAGRLPDPFFPPKKAR